MSDRSITRIDDETNNGNNENNENGPKNENPRPLRRRSIGRSKRNRFWFVGTSILIARIAAVALPLEWVEGFSSFSIHQNQNQNQNFQRRVPAVRWRAGPRDENDSESYRNKDNKISKSFGLMDQESFSFRSKLHKRLVDLQGQLPTTLTIPLDPADAQETYASNCTLVGPNQEILGVDLKEMLSLSQTITTAVQTAQRARQLLRRTMPALSFSDEIDNQSVDGTGQPWIVDCRIILDPSLSEVFVQWKTTLPDTSGTNPLVDASFANSNSGNTRTGSEVVGSSIFVFRPTDAKIQTHQVLGIEWDGRSLPRIAENLASLRRTVKAVQQRSPWVLEAAEVAAPFFKDLVGEDKPERTVRAPIFVAKESVRLRKDSKMRTVEAKDTSQWSIEEDWTVRGRNRTSHPNRLDEYPLPGSSAWVDYEQAHRILSAFATRTLYILASGGEDGAVTLPKSSYRGLFATNIRFLAFDGSLLAKGAGRVADIYRTAARLRDSALPSALAEEQEGAWKITSLDTDWSQRMVRVSWKSDIQVLVEGTDEFHLNPDGEIEKIQQKALRLAGTEIQDSAWMKAITSALENSTGGAGVEILADLFQRFSWTGGDARINRLGSSSVRSNPVPPEMGQEAALQFYMILRSLHSELPKILEEAPLDRTPLSGAPASAFLSENVELRGLLDESLARGKRAYTRALSTSIASLRAAIRTGSVKTTDRDLRPRIEITPSGTILVSLEISLRIEPPSMPTIPGTGGPSNSRSRSPLGIPLELELVSEYRVDKNTGQIVEHRIVENRINGQKSPADLVSNWIQRVEEPGSVATDGAGAVQTFVDAVQWARSLSGN